MPDLSRPFDPTVPARHLAPVPIDSPSRPVPLELGGRPAAGRPLVPGAAEDRSDQPENDDHTDTTRPADSPGHADGPESTDRADRPDASDSRSSPDSPAASSGESSGAPAGGGGEPDPRRWKALAVCLVAVFMTLLDVSIVNVALPDVQKSLGASAADLQWVLSGYALTFGLVLVSAGRFGDIRSRRTAFLLSVAGFVLASAACGIAQGPTFLVVARLVQGLFAGALTPQVSGLIQELFAGRERGKAFGYFGAVAGISTAIGPLLGGLLILLGGSGSGWRLVFYVNLPIGAVALFFARKLLPEGGARQRGETQGGAFDPLGTLLLGAAVVSVLLPLVEEREWAGWHKWLLLVLAAVLGVAFVAWERRVTRRGGASAVDLSLFTKPSFAAGSVVGLVYFAGFTSVFFVWSVFLQEGHHYPAWKAGLATIPAALGLIVTSRLSGGRPASQGPRLVQAGAALFCVGFASAVLILRHVTGDSIGLWLAVPLLVSGLGSGLVVPTNQTSSLSDVDVRQAGVAGAVYQTSLRIGTALGIAVVASTFYNELATSRGDYSRALQRGFAIAVVFGALTFVAALVQGAVRRRTSGDTSRDGHPASPGPRPVLDD